MEQAGAYRISLTGPCYSCPTPFPRLTHPPCRVRPRIGDREAKMVHRLEARVEAKKEVEEAANKEEAEGPHGVVM